MLSLLEKVEKADFTEEEIDFNLKEYGWGIAYEALSQLARKH